MNLQDAMYDTYCESKKWLSISVVASFALAIISAVGTFESLAKLSRVLVLLSFAIQICAFLFRVISEKKLDLAESIHRLFILKDGLDYKPTSKEIAKILRKSGKTNFNKSPATEPYFSTTSPYGKRRLAEILRESTFWTSYLSEYSANVFFGVSFFSLFAFVCTFFAVVTNAQSMETATTFALAALPIMAFMSFSDFLNLAIKFQSLHRSAEEIYNDTNELLSGEEIMSESTVLTLLSEYSCSTAAAPPIPDWIYNRNSKFLDELWKKTYRL